MEEKSLLKLNYKNSYLKLKKQIDYLLDNGADINEQDIRGNTPLCLATYDGNPKIVKYLLDKGADQTIRNNDKDNPLFLSLIQSDRESFNILIDEVVKKNQTFLLNSIDANHETLLMYSFMSSVFREYERDVLLNIFEDLLIKSNYKLNINIQTQNGKTIEDLINQYGEGNKEGYDNKKAKELLEKYKNRAFHSSEKEKKKIIEKTINIKENNFELDLSDDFSFL